MTALASTRLWTHWWLDHRPVPPALPSTPPGRIIHVVHNHPGGRLSGGAGTQQGRRMERPSLRHKAGQFGQGPHHGAAPALGPGPWNDGNVFHHQPLPLVFPRTQLSPLCPFKQMPWRVTLRPWLSTPQLSVGITAGISWQSVSWWGQERRRRRGPPETSPHLVPSTLLYQRVGL